METEYTVKVKKDWKEFDKFCDDYQNDSMLFSSVSLIIQIFPLLGILGTVTGLFVAMNGNADWSNAQNLFEGVSFALSSTVLGILFAVIFKSVDILFVRRDERERGLVQRAESLRGRFVRALLYGAGHSLCGHLQVRGYSVLLQIP